MSIRSVTAIAAGGLLMTLAAGLSPLQAQSSGTVEADANIVREFTTRNLLELRVADIGRKKATNPSVKSFAEQMHADHLKMNDEVTALKGQDGRPFRTPLGKMEAQVAEVRRLEKFSGSQFDQEFMASQIRGHQDNMAYFRVVANLAQSAQVRTLLANDLPVLQQHLNQAVQLGSQVGVAPAVAAGTPNVPSNVPTATPNVPWNVPAATPNLPPSQNAAVASEEERKHAKKDRKFLVEAVQSNALEIRLAQFAEKNTTHGDVKRLAGRMLSEHTAMQRQWLSLAARHGVKLTPGTGPWHLKKAERMEQTPRSDFDRAYTTMLISNNQDYVESFQKEGLTAHSSEVRSQAANDLATFRQHLAGAKKVAAVLGVDTTAAVRGRNLSSNKNQ